MVFALKINNGYKADEVGRLEKKALACVYGEEKHQYLRPVHDAFSIALSFASYIFQVF